MSGLARGASDPSTPIGALSQDPQAGADLKRTLSNLSRSSALLNEDLEAVQHNFLLRRYFRRKARAEARLAEQTDVDAHAP
jgi:phospholipid/cholesterol/gamma-HCH transport system substrate-binding protein